MPTGDLESQPVLTSSGKAASPAGGPYGSVEAPPLAGKVPACGDVGRRRSRISIKGIMLAVFVPWLLFCKVFLVTSFFFRYQQPTLAHILVVLGLLIILGSGLSAVVASWRRQGAEGDDQVHEPSWKAFLCVTGVLAWILAVSAGEANFYSNMEPYYNMANLNTYSAVDPSRTQGQQIMDVGSIIFSEGAKLDLSKSMSFRNQDRYCVAPVSVASSNTSSELQPLVTYDFWAVGVNCCSETGGDFHCSEADNPLARAGLRLMRDEERPFFKLAVQQAEAAHHIKAAHPIFLTWMQEPAGKVIAHRQDGIRWCLTGVLSHLVLQLALVVLAATAASSSSSSACF
jgi:hypothetical protein